MEIPKVTVRSRYFVYLPLIILLSTLLHEFGHALGLVLTGGRILHYGLTNIQAEPNFSDPLFILGGPIVTLLLCFFATSRILVDKKNADVWLATIFSNFRPLLILISYLIYNSPEDEISLFINQLGISAPVFFTLYSLIFLLPMLVLIKAPRLPPHKKIVFYLYSTAILCVEIKFLHILSRAFFTA